MKYISENAKLPGNREFWYIDNFFQLYIMDLSYYIKNFMRSGADSRSADREFGLNCLLTIYKRWFIMYIKDKETNHVF